MAFRARGVVVGEQRREHLAMERRTLDCSIGCRIARRARNWRTHFIPADAPELSLEQPREFRDPLVARSFRCWRTLERTWSRCRIWLSRHLLGARRLHRRGILSQLFLGTCDHTFLGS